MGLETGSQDICGHVVQSGNILMVFKSCLRSTASEEANSQIVNEIQHFVKTHGDGIKDIAFSVDNVHDVLETARSAGAEIIDEPFDLFDKNGKVSMARVKAYGDVTHTLINREAYRGTFLPSYADVTEQYNHYNLFGETKFDCVDHCVGSQGWDEMEPITHFYEKAFGFHRYWSVDEKQIHTDFSALRSTVVASADEVIKMPINEPAEGLRKSQVEEYYTFNEGPGIQHIALLTHDIIETVGTLIRRGVEFMKAPDAYYDRLRSRLSKSKVHIKEALDDIQRLNLLVDFDDRGYLLQIFTRPLTDRPTVFFEIIQRENFDGFGAGNFKSLFEAIEAEQLARGTL